MLLDLSEDFPMRLSPQALLCLIAILVSPVLAFADDKLVVDYQRDVLPLLQTNCYKCHDGKAKKSAYQIDVRSSALRGGESDKAAIVPGNSGKSELIRRIMLAEGGESMPPGNKKLTAEQIRLLRTWVDAGAPWPDSLANESNLRHWAFQSPQRPELP